MSPQHVSQSFDYATAFSRNIGWLTPTEQAWLRGRRLAVAGLGGVGGVHLLTLARLGVGAFHLADFDRFELHNFNRQAGATMATLDRPKLDVMAEAALAINPELDIRRFADGVTDDNLDAFFDGVDLYVDALDFFVLPVRRKVFAAAHARGIPAITAAPLGMGTAVLTFLPGRMSFEDYFQVEGQPEEEQYARFLVGLSPTMLQQGYLVDRSTINFVEKRGPSTPMACELAAGVLVTESLKLLLGRGPVRAAPWGLHFDAYRNRLSRTWRPGGNRHPLNRLTLAIMRTLLRRARSLPAPARAAPAAPAG
ncbi:MAG TPA: ThiF family adenylyltransferase, partial [Plasticicumulans sp.]